MDQVQLTSNAVERVLNGEKFDVFTVQVLSVRQMQHAQKPAEMPRHRLSISDGSKYYTSDRPLQTGFQVNREPAAAKTYGSVNSSSTTLQHGVANSVGEQSSAAPGCYPISSLTPYQNKWKIRVRVMKKNSLRTFTNARGEGKLFSMEILDESGEMKATAFGEQADKFFNVIQENGVYYISGGNIKPADKRYTSIKNDYELIFNPQTEVNPCYDYNVAEMPTVSFDFTKFDRLSSLEPKTMVDVIGILKTVFEEQSVNSRKTNEPLRKRDVVLVDDTQHAVTLTLWREQGDEFKSQEGSFSVVALKGASISDFNGVSLNLGFSSQIHFNPDIKESHALKGWFDKDGYRLEFKSLSRQSAMGGSAGGASDPKLISVADAQNLGADQTKGDFFNIKAAVQFCRAAEALYQACPSENCNKKVIDQQNGNYRCEKCQREFSSFKYRMLLQVQVADFTGAKYLTLFGETGEQLLGKTSEELGKLKDNKQEEYEAAFNEIMFKSFIFRVRAKTEIFNDESRVKWTCMNIAPVNQSEYAKFLEEQIQKLERLT